MSGRMTTAAALSAAVFAMMFGGRTAEARRLPQDLAGKLSGTWVLNRELSTGAAPGPGRGRGGPGYSAPRFATAAVPQRGGRGGLATPTDATDLTPEQRAEQVAMRQLQQIDPRITIKASAETVTFTDARGERTFAVNDKTSTIDVGGSGVKVKSKWDKRALKQEFSNTQAKLVETWGLDEADHLVLTVKLESMTMGVGVDRLTPVNPPERKFVFDRQ
jgi:hypothetical protein